MRSTWRVVDAWWIRILFLEFSSWQILQGWGRGRGVFPQAGELVPDTSSARAGDTALGHLQNLTPGIVPGMCPCARTRLRRELEAEEGTEMVLAVGTGG